MMSHGMCYGIHTLQKQITSHNNLIHDWVINNTEIWVDYIVGGVYALSEALGII